VSTRATWRWTDVPLGSVRRKLEESRTGDNMDVLFVCNTSCLPIQVFFACLTLKMKQYALRMSETTQSHSITFRRLESSAGPL